MPNLKGIERFIRPGAKLPAPYKSRVSRLREYTGSSEDVKVLGGSLQNLKLALDDVEQREAGRSK